MMKKTFVLFMILFLFTVFSASTVASQELNLPSLQAEDEGQVDDLARSPEEALERDAQWYAAHFNVPFEEALRRLRLQKDIAELNRQLIEKEAETFAGLWIEHSPNYRVIVLFTTDGKEMIEKYVTNSPLAELIDIGTARVSLKKLEAEQDRVVELTKQFGIEAHTGLNLSNNAVDLYVRDKNQLIDALEERSESLPPNVRIVESVLDLKPLWWA